MESERWSMAGCKGRFFLRGNIIWYKRGRSVCISTGLQSTRQNRKLAGEKILLMENPEFETAANAPRTVLDAFEQFLKQSLNTKHKNTLYQYGYAYKFLIIENVPLNIQKIRNVIDNALHKPLGKRTQKTYLQRMKSFFQFCVKNKWLSENPIDDDYKIKLPDKIIEIYSDYELNIIFDYWERDETYLNYLKLLYTCAFRRSECMELTWEQIWHGRQFRPQIIFQSSKFGNRPDFFPLAEPVREIFEALPSYRHRTGKVFPYNDVRNLSRRFRRGMQELEIQSQTIAFKGYGRNLHTFRKTRITKWLFEDNLTPQVVSVLSRDSIETIMKYYAQTDSNNLTQYIKNCTTFVPPTAKNTAEYGTKTSMRNTKQLINTNTTTGAKR
jgi:integrase